MLHINQCKSSTKAVITIYQSFLILDIWSFDFLMTSIRRFSFFNCIAHSDSQSAVAICQIGRT